MYAELNRLQATLTTRCFGRSVAFHASLASTQDEARRLGREGAPEGTLVWALEQTAGRGRLQRSWHSPAGCGLWASLLLRPPPEPAQAAFLGIVAGVALAKGLRGLSGRDVRLKWPNDLRLDDRKLGGLLAEAVIAGGEVREVILGFGINLLEPPGGFPPELSEVAIGLYGSGMELDLGAHLAALLGALEDGVERWRAEGPEPARRGWLALSETIGRTVRAELPEGTVSGTAVDLAADGSLILELAPGLRREVRWGDVVHLR